MTEQPALRKRANVQTWQRANVQTYKRANVCRCIPILNLQKKAASGQKASGIAAATAARPGWGCGPDLRAWYRRRIEPRLDTGQGSYQLGKLRALACRRERAESAVTAIAREVLPFRVGGAGLLSRPFAGTMGPRQTCCIEESDTMDVPERIARYTAGERLCQKAHLDAPAWARAWSAERKGWEPM